MQVRRRKQAEGGGGTQREGQECDQVISENSTEEREGPETAGKRESALRFYALDLEGI
jgi:hypothetical protein